MGSMILPSSTLASYKNQQLGGLLTGAGTGIGAPMSPQLQALQTKATLSPVGQIGANTQQNVLAGSKRLTQNTQMAAQIAAARRRKAAAANIPAAGGAIAASGAGGASNVGLGGAYGMTPAAGAKLQALQAAARAAGLNIGVTEGGRTRARQQQLYDLYRSGKGNLAAKPGHSVHETGRAVDLKMSAGVFNWLKANAAKFGFWWAGGTFKQTEPWHWEYRG
jgi:LAS superfamily LD-carboxypeptidase LdcB